MCMYMYIINTRNRINKYIILFTFFVFFFDFKPDGIINTGVRD